jgi:hypothetical protein
MAAAVVIAMTAPEAARATWDLDGTLVCSAAGVQENPVTVADGSGGAFVVWRDKREPDTARVYAQHLDANGGVVAGWPANGQRVSTSIHPMIEFGAASDGSGGFYVTWYEPQFVGAASIRLIRVQSSGAPAAGWPSNGIALNTASGADDRPMVIGDGGGGAIVTWMRNPNYPTGGFNDFRVFAQRVNASAGVVWTAGGVQASSVPVEFLAGGGQIQSIAGGSGGVVITWRVRNTQTLQAQKLGSLGLVSGGWPAAGIAVCTNPISGVPSIVTDGSGGAYIAWTDDRDAERDAYIVRVNSSGAIPAGWTVNGGILSASPTLVEQGVELVADGSGGVVALWHWLNSTRETMSRRFAADGSTLWSPSLLVKLAHTVAFELKGVRTTSGDFIVIGDEGVVADRYFAAGLDPLARPTMALGGSTFRSTSPGGSSGQVSVAASEASASIAAWSDMRADAGDIYALRIQSRSNLKADFTVPTWQSPAVPHNMTWPGPSPVFVTGLDGNTANTYLSWTTVQAGPNQLPAWDSDLRLDNEDLVGSLPVADGNSGGIAYFALNNGPITVRGGRHCLTIDADPGDLIPETSEADNLWEGQWVWSPLVTARAAAVVRPEPPLPCYHVEPSADGFSFTRNSNVAWVAGVAPRTPGDDYDLYLYDDYTDPFNGFSNFIGASAQGSNETDFVVGHYSGTPTTVFPAAVRFSSGGGGNDFVQDQTDALSRGAAGTGYFPHQSLAANRVVDVYEAFLTSGEGYSFTLERESGTADIAMSIFPATPGTINSRAFALGTSSPSTAYFDLMSFTATETGWHPIVVFRPDGTDAATPLTYTLKWDQGLADAPSPFIPGQLAFSGAIPNPVRGQASFVVDLPVSGPLRLSVFDAGGRRVSTIADGHTEAGRHRITWDGRGVAGLPVAPGLYYARLEALDRTLSRRLVMLR